MNRLEQLKNEKRAWSVEETADFLGFSRNYVYELIHAGKIEGWFVGDKGGYRFCPAKLAMWLEKKMAECSQRAGNGKPAGNGDATKVHDLDSDQLKKALADDTSPVAKPGKGGEAA
jgi:excisionase family DNA binding protein